jgi:transposase
MRKEHHEKRASIIHFLETNIGNRRDAARVFQVAYSKVCNIMRIYLDTGVMTPGVRGGHRPPKLNDAHKQSIKGWIDEDSAMTLNEICAKLLHDFQISVSISTVQLAIKGKSSFFNSFLFFNICLLLGFHYSFKRIHHIPAAATTPALLLERREFSAWYLNMLHDNRTILFTDETGFKLSCRLGYGRDT